MEYSVTWTARSVSDLNECVSFVLKVSKEAAISLYQKIKSSVEDLKMLPERNPIFEMPKSFPFIVRKLIIDSRYIVLYVVKDKEILIFRVLDARRKFESLL